PIAHAMFASLEPVLRRGAVIHSRSTEVFLREGDFALELEQIARAHPDVEIGSYPFARDGRYGASLVVRGTDLATVESVLGEVERAMTRLVESREADAQE